GRGERPTRDDRPARGDRGSRGARGAPRVIIEGRVSLNRRGFGFVVDSEGREEDLYMPPDELAGVLDGDEIRAEVREGREGRTMGRLLAILKRARRQVVGLVRRTPRGAELIPDGATYRQRFVIDEPRERRGRPTSPRTRPAPPVEELRDDEPILGELIDMPARTPHASQRVADGEVAEVEIIEYPTQIRPGLARVLEILGDEGDPEVEVERIIRRFGLTAEFPEPVLAEARAIAETVNEEDVRGRRDLRAEPIVTIDGETARDFDDAVSVKQEANGVVRLTVSIADVAHYVVDGGALDAEARDRGTSVYFPSRVIPMLPERLSNGICSLNPNVDRLTLTAEMTIDREGRVLTTAFYESVIRSAARLTYTKVAAVLRGDTIAEIEHLRPQLLLMGEVMTRLRRARRRRGSIDFDLPEPEVLIDMTTGEPDAIIRSERNDAHRLIEEMMIAANEAVARWFVERKHPSIYRVHAPPDPKKLENFAIVARAFGFTPPATSSAAAIPLANFVDAIEGKPAARALNTLLLRSMMRAAYSEQNIGHFGLASRAYLHFTSPIRRYPDLMVHRLLKAHLAGQSSRLPGATSLAETAKSSSVAERTADLAEYAVVDYWRARFMLDKVGEEYDGLVSGVAEFGVFVELIEYFVEGLIRVSDLSSDFFNLSDTGHALVGRKSGLAFTIGDQVRIAVESVNLSEGRVEFRLVRKIAPI
ncbi:MAG: ribonuclease R, partial [bacterium]